MTTVAVISDTHLPAAGPALPAWATELIAEATHVLHAGDVINPGALDDLRELAGGSLTAVAGNRDHSLALPSEAIYEIDGVRFAVTHGHALGTDATYRAGLAALAREHEADIAVGGHTHQLVDETVDGIRVLNPGSVTGAVPAREQSMLSVHCSDGSFRVRHHRH